MRGWPGAACLLLPPARHLLPLGDLPEQAGLHSLHSMHGRASQLPLPPPSDSSRLLPRRGSRPRACSPDPGGQMSQPCFWHGLPPSSRLVSPYSQAVPLLLGLSAHLPV